MKCDFCGREFKPNEEDLMFEFITKSGKTIKPCDDCQEFDCYGCEHKQTD